MVSPSPLIITVSLSNVYMFLLILFAIIILSIAIGSQLSSFTREGFKTSTESAIEEGASGAYKWGYQPIPEPIPVPVPIPEPPFCPPRPGPGPRPPCPRCGFNITEIIINEPAGGCAGCDITRHPDIDKYVLKSSIPPCPDMTRYALKSEMCPCVNMNDYIRKSEIPPCPSGSGRGSGGRDGDDRYMLKTDCTSYNFTAKDDYKLWLKERKDREREEGNDEGDGGWYEQRAADAKSASDGLPREQLGKPAPGGVKAYNQIGMIV